MGKVKGGGKTSEVEASVTPKPSKEIAKGHSKLKTDDDEEEEEGEDHHEEAGGDHHEGPAEKPAEKPKK